LQPEAGLTPGAAVKLLPEAKILTATITRTSGETLGFRAGERATAMIKASHIILAAE
jgi:molybdopterin-binding protein